MPPKLCNFIVRGQVCRFGGSCKFSHDVSGRGSGRSDNQWSGNQNGGRGGRGGRGRGNNSPRPPRAPPTHLEGVRRRWSHSLTHFLALDPTVLAETIQSALAMVNSGESGVKQDVINDLGGENGLQWIRNIVESPFSPGESRYELSFVNHCVPFLQLLTHDEILSSLVLEKAVGTIYNVIYGPSGIRGIGFMEEVAENMRMLSVAEGGIGEKFGKALAASSRALLCILELNQESMVKEQFKDVAKTFATCLEAGDGNEYHMRLAATNIRRIRDKLHIGEELPGLGNYAPLVPVSRLQIPVDLPGELSSKGPRHGNDHAEIEKISILPTTEEILATRSEFLPLKDRRAQHHEEGIARLLDSQFRLLREDTAGQLRDAVCHLVAKWDTVVNGKNAQKRRQSLRQINAKLNIFERVHIEGLRYHRRGGLIIDLSFNQPEQLLRKETDPRKRAAYWKDSRELQRGALVALVDIDHETTFLLVSDRNEQAPAEARRDPNGNPVEDKTKKPKDLSSHPLRALISLSLVDPTSTLDQKRILKLAQEFRPTSAVLVEFPGLLFASFQPILKVLQALHKNPNLPFGQWLVPLPDVKYEAEEGFVCLPPPLYMAKGDLEIDLSCITTDGHRLTHSVTRPVKIEELEAHTTLDRGQCKGLLLSLQSELALIQGPPGTGKSYVGLQIARILLKNAKKLKIGPIICVCYTNHALDQLLEHILDAGETNIIRLGSRSKSERVQECTLAKRSSGIAKTRAESINIGKCMGVLEGVQEDLEAILPHLSRPFSPKDIVHFLQKQGDLHIHKEIFGSGIADEEGFVEASKLSPAQALNRWTTGYQKPGKQVPPANRDMDIHAILQFILENSVWCLTTNERRRLKAYWQDTIVKNRMEELCDCMNGHVDTNQILQRQYDETNKRCLEEAGVIGVTTTGLASSSELLRSLPSKVLLIEEAAEVLEAHTIAALLPSVQHAILIGDHLQLRAQIAKYELSMESEQGKRYGLDESLFERLAREEYGDANARMPVAKLNVQRRMHPSIASLVRNTLYPDLQDHPETAHRPDVPGMRRRLFWLDHEHREDAASNDVNQTSKTNEWEAEMVLALVRHLSRQGVYKKGEIAVLTPYLGQLRKLRNKFNGVTELLIGDRDMQDIVLAEQDEEEEEVSAQLSMGGQVVRKGKLVEGLRLATVDNFQGEEAKVIVISLVRSNPERKCGFLKTFNRINVLLSRARDGMYIIGDGQTASPVKMWSDVIKLLERDNNISPQLELMCARHPSTLIGVSEPDDFNKLAPEGGCDERCGRRLNCGHVCTFKCHAEALHNDVKCTEDCTRQFKYCEHTCPKRCYEHCGECRAPITTNITLPCGHTPASLPCHETRDLTKVRCMAKVTRKLPVCGHEEVLRCYTDVNDWQCRQKCGIMLPCGHQCQRICTDCWKRPKGKGPVLDHGSCIAACGKAYKLCSHSCVKTCHPEDQACTPCEQPCEVRCAHSRCNRRCSDPCPPCALQCTWSCPHRGQCSMPCGVPCDMVPCKSIRCERLLACGHQCPSICGEECPSPKYCQECASEDILDKVVDYIMYSSYRDADVSEEPLIFLSCGHFFKVETLDGHVGLGDIYEVDPATGDIMGPKPIHEPKLKGCPDCRAPMLDIHRYNRANKAAQLEESHRRFMSRSVNELAHHTELVEQWEKALEQRVDQFRTEKESGRMFSRAAKNNAYYRAATEYLQIIQSYADSVKLEEQPYGRVHSMVVDAKRRRNVTSQFNISAENVQHGAYFRSRCLLLRLQFAVLWNLKDLTKEIETEDLITKNWVKCLVPDLAIAHESALVLHQEAKDRKFVKESVEARILAIQFIAISLLDPTMSERFTDPEAKRKELRAEARSLATSALADIEGKPSSVYMIQQIEKAQDLIRGAVFYDFVTPEEKKQVLLAMQREFQGTGHWYQCVNGHPFTIGECGGPMVTTRCPECGEQVGGQNHMAAEGVSRADELENQLRGMQIQ